MLTLVLLAMFSLAEKKFQEIDFGTRSAGAQWQIINDGVMGGLSAGGMELDKNSVVFSGVVSLENNGGFSSMKGPWEKQDLSVYSGVKIRYKSEGIMVGMTMETSQAWFKPYYKALLEKNTDGWQEVFIPFGEFRQYQVGRDTKVRITEEQLQSVIRVGFITSEKKAGPFRFEVDYIRFE